MHTHIRLKCGNSYSYAGKYHSTFHYQTAYNIGGGNMGAMAPL